MKKLLLFCFVLFCFFQISFAQCVNPRPSGPTTQTFCATQDRNVGNLIITSGNNIVWFSEAVGGVSYDNLAKITTGVYYADDTTNGSCSTTRLKVDVIIFANPPQAFLSITDCAIDKPTISDLFVSGSNIEWFNAETGGTNLPTSTLLQSGQTYWSQQTENGCVSKRSSTRVVLLDPRAPTVLDPIQVFCKINNPTTSNLRVQLNNINNSVSWYATETSTVPLDPRQQLVNGVDYWASEVETLLSCESTMRTKVSVVVHSTPKPAVSSESQAFCENLKPTIANIIIAGTGIKWYNSNTSTTVLNTTDALVNGRDYYATQTNSTTGCESSERTKITVTINSTPAPTANTPTQTFCKTSEALVSNLVVTGTNIKWYDSLISTTALSPTEQLVDGKDYYATQTNSSTGCESLERTKVSVVFRITSAPTTTSKIIQAFCSINNPTLANIEIVGTSIKWYDSLTSTTPLDSTTALENGKEYYATQTNSTTGCESVERTKIKVAIEVVLAPTTTKTTQSFCLNNTPTLANFEIEGNGIKWYDSLTSTTPLTSTTSLENNKIYYATQTNSSTGCESVLRLEITAVIDEVNQPVLDFKGEDFCRNDGSFTISDLNDKVTISSGNTIIWYDSFPNGNVLSLSELLKHNVTYFAVEQNVNGCISSEPLEVLVNLDDCELELIIYDGFSPDNDGINEEFTIKNVVILYPNYEINIYNRWGNIVYKGNADKPFWNGQLNGKGEHAPTGIYYYILELNKDGKAPIQGRFYLSRKY